MPAKKGGVAAALNRPHMKKPRAANRRGLLPTHYIIDISGA